MNDKPNYPPIRRVVTGHDAGNVAKVLIDAPATNAKNPSGGVVSTMIWCTDGAPAQVPVGEKSRTWVRASSARRRRRAARGLP